MASPKTYPLYLLLTAVLLAGCTHTREVSNEPTSDYTFTRVNETLEGRLVDIHLSDDRTISSKALLIRPDSTWSIDMLNGSIRGAATHDIYAVTRTDPGKGAVEGAALGAAGGALVGLGVGFALTSARDADIARTSLAQYVSVPTAFFAILGIGTGTLLGINKGSREHYVYPQLPRRTEETSAQAQGSMETAATTSKH